MHNHRPTVWRAALPASRPQGEFQLEADVRVVQRGAEHGLELVHPVARGLAVNVQAGRGLADAAGLQPGGGAGQRDRRGHGRRLQRAVPLLADNGYCVFAANFGGTPGNLLQGTGDITQSAAELASFVTQVLAATGASKVDLVGHSQGGMMPRYYLKFLGGAPKVQTLVGLAPSNHGTTLDGLATLTDELATVPALAAAPDERAHVSVAPLRAS